MRVLIFEPDSDGHRLHYVRNMILALREFLSPADITVALASNAPENASFKVHLADLKAQATFDAWVTPTPRSVMKGATHRVKMLQQSIARAKAEWLQVPYADGLGQILGMRQSVGLPTLPRGLHSEALMLRGGFAYPNDSFKGRMSAKLSWSAACRAPWEFVHVLDPVVHRASGWGELMPDPIELPTSFDRNAARTAMNLPTDGRVISCVGVIDSRKGVPLLIRGFAEASLSATDRLLLAGPHRPEIRALLDGEFAPLVKQGRIISVDRTLPVEDLMTALVASDLVCALYPRHIGSASVAIRAAAAGRPTLGQDFGWLKEVIPKFDLGWLCNATDSNALKAALVKALDQSAEFEVGEKARRFVEFHRIENFRAHWTAHLRKHLNLPPAEFWRSWEWVLEAH